MNWQERAACADVAVDPEWFFPELPGLAGNRAKAICRRCPVINSCLALALREPVCGIWGGTSKSQRVSMRRDMGIKLPSGWAARAQVSEWERRYFELRDLGYNDLQIVNRWNVKPQSLLRQLNRYDITPSQLLVQTARAHEHRKSVDA